MTKKPSQKNMRTDQKMVGQVPRAKETTELSEHNVFDYEIVVSDEWFQIIGNPHLLQERLKEVKK